MNPIKDMKKILGVAFVLGLTMLLPVAETARAQDTGEDNATALELPEIHNNQISLPLKSVLMLALKNNLDITFASLQPEIAATDVSREKSAYDTMFTAQFSKYRENKQVGNALSGGTASGVIYQEQHDLDVLLQKRFTLGTIAELELKHQQYQSDLPFLGLKPQYSGDLAFSLTQPLLRDFGIAIGRSLIKIATLNHEVSERQFRQQGL